MKNRKLSFILLAVAVLVGAAIFLFQCRWCVPARPASAVEEGEILEEAVEEMLEETSADVEDEGDETSEEDEMPVEDEDAEPENEEPQTEEERRAAEEEKLVDAFDNLTDKWLEPTETAVTMKDVEAFREQFRKVPQTRKDECIHRALNLVPDENVMLLAGILMDKTQDKDILETVYNDILNRDEDVKRPILQQVFKDRTHPCWTDTAWILDVTDDLPKASADQTNGGADQSASGASGE